MQAKFSDEAVGSFDKGHLFTKGVNRFCLLDGDVLYIENTHFDKGSYICTKNAFDPALRDPQGRCYDCDQRKDDPRQTAIFNVLIYRVDNLGHTGYRPDDPNLYGIDYLKMGGKRIADLKQVMQAMGDSRVRDLIFQCDDPGFQSGNYIPQMEAWWLHNQQPIVQLWETKKYTPEQLQLKLGKPGTYEGRVAEAIAKQQKQAGISPGGASQVANVLSVQAVTERMAQQGAVWGVQPGAVGTLPPASPGATFQPGVLPGIGAVLPGGLGGIGQMPTGVPAAQEKNQLEALLAQMSGAGK